MISAVFVVYNEAHRIANAIRGARTWASEVLVIDKSSTDATREVALTNGARVKVIPYSDAGDTPDTESYFSHANNNWILWLTPSEQFSLGLASLLKGFSTNLSALNESVDVIFLPVKLYSFGQHVFRAQGPWSISSQPRLINRKLARYVDRVHVHYRGSCKSKIINYSSEIFLAHYTHASFASFMRNHLSYATLEARDSVDKIERAHRAIAEASKYDFVFSSEGKSSLPQMIAWKIYNLMIALACLDKEESQKIRYFYEAESARLLRDLEENLK